MRHRKRGRTLGRSPSHRRAMLRNLASSLFLTERDAESDDNAPKVKGRVVTTLPKAKEVRPLVEKCITIARRSFVHEEEAERYETQAERGTEEWKNWRQSDEWRKWCQAKAPGVAARRRALQLLGDKEAVRILFDEVAPRFLDRDGGYTRILKLANPRLGDAGDRAVLEFVGVHDRVTARSEKPAFADTEEPEETPESREEEPLPEQEEPSSEEPRAEGAGEPSDSGGEEETGREEEEK